MLSAERLLQVAARRTLPDHWLPRLCQRADRSAGASCPISSSHHSHSFLDRSHFDLGSQADGLGVYHCRERDRMLHRAGGSLGSNPRRLGVAIAKIGSDLRFDLGGWPATIAANRFTISSLTHILSKMSWSPVRAGSSAEIFSSGIADSSPARASQYSTWSRPSCLKTERKSSSKRGIQRNLWIERSISLQRNPNYLQPQNTLDLRWLSAHSDCSACWSTCWASNLQRGDMGRIHPISRGRVPGSGTGWSSR